MSCTHEAAMQALERDASATAVPQQIASCDEVIAAFGDADDASSRVLVARAMHHKMRALSLANREEEAERVAEQLRNRFGRAEPEARTWVCYALFGLAQSRRGPRRDRLIVDYREILDIALAEPPLDRFAAEALYLMGQCGSYRQPTDPIVKQANAALHELERRYLASEDPEIAQWVTSGLLLLAGRSFPESEEARSIYRTLVDAYGEAPDALRLHAARALSAWGLRLMRRDPELALDVFDEGWERFHSLPAPQIQALLAGDSINRALVLAQVDGPEAEIQAYEDLLSAYEASPWPAVQRWVVAAAENLAITLRGMGRKEEAKPILERVLARLGPATEPKELVAAIAKARQCLATLG